MSVKSKRIFNSLILLLLGYFLFLNLKGSLEQVSYHVLHIDERQVIDSILNVFQINDEFGRFDSVENEVLKKILIVLGELIIGGNLDFGRLWNNLFVFIAGPFYFINTETMIIIERLVQISFFYISIIYFAYNFIDYKKAPLFLLASFSVPGAYYIIENPKPDSLLMLFLLISFKKIFKDEKYNLGFLFIGIAIGLKIIAVVPVRGDTISINGKPLLCFTLDNAKKSKFLDKIFVSTDSQYTSQIATENGAECPFIRPSDYSLPHVNLETVQKYSLEMIEKNNYFPDLIVHLQETFPFRHDQLIDDMILSLLENGYDSVIASKREPGWIWKETENGDFQRIDSGDIPRDFKQSSFIGLHGCGCVTYPEYIRNNKILGNKIGMLKVKHPLAAFEIRNEEQSKVLSNHLNNLYINEEKI